MRTSLGVCTLRSSPSGVVSLHESFLLRKPAYSPLLGSDIASPTGTGASGGVDGPQLSSSILTLTHEKYAAMAFSPPQTSGHDLALYAE